MTPAAVDALADAGFDPDYGARPLRRAIRSRVEDRAAELLLSGEAAPGSALEVDAGADGLVLSPIVLPATTKETGDLS